LNNKVFDIIDTRCNHEVEDMAILTFEEGKSLQKLTQDTECN